MKHHEKERGPSRSEESDERIRSDHQVSLFRAWCKRCGNCAAFCPKDVFEMDEWGYPRVVRPERCTACHLCEKLCPDFAITVAASDRIKDEETAGKPTPVSSRFHEDRSHSPERLAPDPRDEEEPAD